MKARRLAAIGLALALAGCASVGNDRLQDADSSRIRLLLQDTQTPQRDRLRALLGRPDDTVRFDNGREVWVYRSDKYAPKWQNFTKIAPFLRAQTHSVKELTVLFSPTGQALQWRLQDESRDENTGLLNRGVSVPARPG
ncbi:hypothetical protein [Chromobacterium paludis]|uniref:Outer membrane protein assembly factor BamE n=1 Tax=Chromobacterium paludis TaxID=2605945 RepID=A0A5C1DJR9_9NEIS|nr:hypothetical protein [Chromobacterium paludis]QEL56872.1 hypothetical protein FYK34_15535 [Chromobacterium paludis]